MRRHTERKFLQGAVVSLWEKEIDDHNLKRDPATIHDKPFPGNISKSDGIDEGSEESGSSTEELEEGEPTSSFSVWEELNQVGIGQRVKSDVVGRRVEEDEEDHHLSGGHIERELRIDFMLLLGFHIECHANSPADVYC